MIAVVFPPDPRVYRGSPREVVADLMARTSGWSGDRSRLGPFCAWLSARTRTMVGVCPPVDAGLPDDEAAAELIDAMRAVGALFDDGSRP